MGDTSVAVGGDAAGASASGPVSDPILTAARALGGEFESE